MEDAEAIEAQIRAKAVQPQPAGYPAAQFAGQPGYPAPAGYYPTQQVHYRVPGSQLIPRIRIRSLDCAVNYHQRQKGQENVKKRKSNT